MAKPTIVTVDDEPQVLNAIERDLRRKFQADYRVLKVGSGAAALEMLQKLKQRNDSVALIVSDQRMPEMSGTEFLTQAKDVFPEARKVLLTAYADTEAAIDSINTIGLDFYLMKPWDPPDQNLYPVLEDLLEDWHANAEAPYDGIRVAGTLWSAASHEVKDFLARNRVPYQWLDISKNAEARQLVEAAQPGVDVPKLPVVFMPDGKVMIGPDRTMLAGACGMQTEASRPFYDLVVIGAGPAGLAAAVYGAAEGLSTVVIEQAAAGGQAGTSSRIENYLGFPKGLSGSDLARRAQAQAERLGAELLIPQEVKGLRVEDHYKIVTLADGTELTCSALLMATGVDVRRLDVPGIDAVTGAGVYYGAALTEAAHYRDQPVFVIGGANSAGQGAMFFSRYASKVTMLVRANGLEKSMSTYLIEQIAGTPNIEVQTRKQVVKVEGHERLEAIHVENLETEEVERVEAAAMFIFIGAQPRTELVEGLVERSEQGFLLTGSDLQQDDGKYRGWPLKRPPLVLETSVPGLFAAGDVRDGSSKRVAAAVGEGSVAVQMIHRYLATV